MNDESNHDTTDEMNGGLPAGARGAGGGSGTGGGSTPGEGTFPLIILIGRPAAGKSEVIRYLHRTTASTRARDLHVGELEEVDDFPMIWSWFEEDDIRARNGKPRVHTDAGGYFLDEFQWHLLVERLEMDYWKIRKDDPDHERTVIMEFARGTEHGGFRAAFEHLSADLLREAAIVYIDVSYEESRRKNRSRFNPDKPYSILEHGLPDDKLDRLYRGNDWSDLLSAADVMSSPGSAPVSGRMNFTDVAVPFAVLANDDDVTTAGGEALADRIRSTLGALWKVRAQREGERAPDEPVRDERRNRVPSENRLPGMAAGSTGIRIVVNDESHLAAHESEMLLSRAEVEAIIRRELSGAKREGSVRISFRYSSPVGWSGLRKVKLHDRRAFWAQRPKRTILSHLIESRRRKTRWLCVWGEWLDSETFRLFTFYPGRPAPKEIHDPSISAEELKLAVPFWARHAIISDGRDRPNG